MSVMLKTSAQAGIHIIDHAEFCNVHISVYDFEDFLAKLAFIFLDFLSGYYLVSLMLSSDRTPQLYSMTTRSLL